MKKLALSIGAVLLFSGCLYTQARGELVEAELRKHQERIRELETQVMHQREELAAENRSASEKVAELREVIQEATDIVTRNSADVGADVEALKARLASVDGLLEELRHHLETHQVTSKERMDALEASLRQFAIRAGVAIELADHELPPDPKAHLDEAVRASEAGEHGMAQALLRAFLVRYPADARLEEARYLLGESYLKSDKPQQALGAFQEIIRHHRDGARMADTLFLMAEAFSVLGSCNDAKAALEALVRTHSRSPHVAAANAELKAIGQGKGRCQR